MLHKSGLILTVLPLFCIVLFNSCTNETIIGSSQSEESVLSGVCEESAISSEIPNISNAADEIINLFFLTGDGKIYKTRCYNSIEEMEILLSTQENEHIEAGEIVEIVNPSVVSIISRMIIGDNILSGQEEIISIGIYKTVFDLAGASWGCIKAAASCPDVMECLKKCDEEIKGPKKFIVAF